MLARRRRACCRGPTAPGAGAAGPSRRSRRAARSRAPWPARAPRRGARRRSRRRSGAPRSRRAASWSAGGCARRAARAPRPRGPASIDSCTEATISRSPSSATRRSRNSITSGKLWPVSTCSSGNGKRAGAERLLGQPQQHDRVLAAREQQRRALALGGDLAHDVDGLGLEVLEVGQTCRPHSVFSLPAQRPSRPLPACVQCVQPIESYPRSCNGLRGQPVIGDVGPHVALGPARERVELPQPVLGVPAGLLDVRPRRRLLAPHAGDPGVEPAQRAAERRDLADRRSSAAGSVSHSRSGGSEAANTSTFVP